uniref:40S ribosomal protein S21 n=1 Tax=Schistosoma japonicum TaxID=6182 RepID=C1LAK5_SCHJA|nr:Ribosomal Protein, Small subunit [Schistosoma japonicum]
MQNEAGEFVDIYLPRRWAVTNRLIGAKDHASIQIQFVDLDPKTGRMIGSRKTYDLSGSIRSMGEVDDCINMLAVRDGMLPPNFCERSFS